MVARILFAVLFMAAGVMHFAVPRLYVRIMPPYLPAHEALVFLSGLCEILGGLGLLFAPPIRNFAAWGLVALLIAVMPANIYMATDHASYPTLPVWALYLRLPLQIPLIWWAWLYTRR